MIQRDYHNGYILKNESASRLLIIHELLYFFHRQRNESLKISKQHSRPPMKSPYGLLFFVM